MEQQIETPWGKSVFVTSLINDGEIISVRTNDHGGIGVSLKLEMPTYLAEPGVVFNSYRWFEQDNTWACVVIAFPGYFDSTVVELTEPWLRKWFPDAHKRHFGCEFVHQRESAHRSQFSLSAAI
jgi:hypothetical protein